MKFINKFISLLISIALICSCLICDFSIVNAKTKKIPNQLLKSEASQKTGVQEVEEAVEEIKKGIEGWLRDNKGSRGYEIPDNTRFEYLG